VISIDDEVHCRQEFRWNRLYYFPVGDRGWIICATQNQATGGKLLDALSHDVGSGEIVACISWNCQNGGGLMATISLES
jgi:hypothetical protein